MLQIVRAKTGRMVWITSSGIHFKFVFFRGKRSLNLCVGMRNTTSFLSSVSSVLPVFWWIEQNLMFGFTSGLRCCKCEINIPAGWAVHMWCLSVTEVIHVTDFYTSLLLFLTNIINYKHVNTRFGFLSIWWGLGTQYERWTQLLCWLLKFHFETRRWVFVLSW